MNLFTSQELEEKVCGLQGRFDRELLKGNTSYGDDYTSETPVIERFWTVISDIFTHEQKKLFLIFVSGRSTLPSCDANFSSRFVITRLDVRWNGCRSNTSMYVAIPSRKNENKRIPFALFPRSIYVLFHPCVVALYNSRDHV